MATPKAKALVTLQKLVRLKAATDDGYCQCVTCNTWHHWKSCDAGHFIAKSHSNYWMLDERNIHVQCKACNGWGMRFGTAQIEYTRWMEDFYGKDFVTEMLETKRHPIKYYKKDLTELTKAWNEQIKEQLARIAD